MAGRIKREDVELVRERVRVEEVVGERVALKPAGSGSLKGLCPFHDERTPSFHVRPPLGVWHCFGCGQGGDTIAFLRQADSLTFTEAIEHLASRYGIVLHYEASAGREAEVSGRGRIIEANRVAAEFFANALASPEAQPGRKFLTARGFDREVAERYGIGYSPNSWDALLRHLRSKGFTEAEIASSGLVSQSQRGYYDRFRGRLIWPIRDLTGSVVGFGARKLDESDQGPKYLNTPETPVYHKSSVLYGVDLAKRDIARERRAVIVEGYTDVMAAHLAGVPTAIATCGTAFGEEHVRVVRRLMGDSAGSTVPGKVVFTFDGDQAGQKAAMRAFEQDQSFYADTYVAVAPDGMDPCELRQSQGDGAVRELVANAVPMFKFAILTVFAQLNLDAPEGRVAALRYAAPVVARLRDKGLRSEYARLLAGWIGLPERSVSDEVRRVSRSGRRGGDAGPGGGGDPGSAEYGSGGPRSGVGSGPRAGGRVARLEYETLMAVLQAPDAVPATFDQLDGTAFSSPDFRSIHDAIRAVGGVGSVAELGGPAKWLEAVRATAASVVAGLVTELAVTPMPIEEEPASAAARGEEVDKRRDYVHGLVFKLADELMLRQIGQLRAQMGSPAAAANPAEQAAMLERMRLLEAQRRDLGGES
ncbi:MAG: DNA primase [Bifidobacteriaceae bacterium]|nr:DNA primase [Bifidobacteriaceae bacterium]